MAVEDGAVATRGTDGAAAPVIDPGSASVAKAEWWRAVLGEYPTGVCLITSVDASGDPIGMIVGSFVAISQNPPLVGFFGDDASVSFRGVTGSGRFTASVLGDAHDVVSRSFIRKDADRFDRFDFERTPAGALRIADAAAWFDADILTVDRYGDHRLVVGRVADFGVGSANAGLPLIYRRGGYGSFAVPSDAVDARLVGERLGAANAAAGVLSAVAQELARDIAITTVVGESVIVLAIVPGHPATRSRPPIMDADDPFRPIGIAFPFAAPVEPLFAAWASDRRRSGWMEQARHLVGSIDRTGLESQLATVRTRGYALSVDRDLTQRFYGLVSDRAAERESYARVWSEFAAQTVESIDGSIALSDIAALEVPVFDGSGEVALGLTVSDLEPFGDAAALEHFVEPLLRAARFVTGAIGGRAPTG